MAEATAAARRALEELRPKHAAAVRTAGEAQREAAKLGRQVRALARLCGEPSQREAVRVLPPKSREPYPDATRWCDMDDVNLSVRADRSIVMLMGLEPYGDASAATFTFGELRAKLSERALLRVKWTGRHTVREIRAWLATMGLELPESVGGGR